MCVCACVFGVIVTKWCHNFFKHTLVRNGKYIAVQYGMMILPALVSKVGNLLVRNIDICHISFSKKIILVYIYIYITVLDQNR